MKTIKVLQPYLHQGAALHPKLAYSMPDDVADGLVALGLAEYSVEAPDLTYSALTWEAGTQRADQIQPAPIVHPQE